MNQRCPECGDELGTVSGDCMRHNELYAAAELADSITHVVWGVHRGDWWWALQRQSDVNHWLEVIQQMKAQRVVLDARTLWDPIGERGQA